MKKDKNAVIVFDVNLDEYRVIDKRNKRGIIKYILTKVEIEHDIRISCAEMEENL